MGDGLGCLRAICHSERRRCHPGGRHPCSWLKPASTLLASLPLSPRRTPSMWAASTGACTATPTLSSSTSCSPPCAAATAPRVRALRGGGVGQGGEDGSSQAAGLRACAPPSARPARCAPPANQLANPCAPSLPPSPPSPSADRSGGHGVRDAGGRLGGWQLRGWGSGKPRGQRCGQAHARCTRARPAELRRRPAPALAPAAGLAHHVSTRPPSIQQVKLISAYRGTFPMYSDSGEES